MTQDDLDKLWDAWKAAEKRADIAFDNLENARKAHKQIIKERNEKLDLYVKAKCSEEGEMLKSHKMT